MRITQSTHHPLDARLPRCPPKVHGGSRAGPDPCVGQGSLGDQVLPGLDHTWFPLVSLASGMALLSTCSRVLLSLTNPFLTLHPLPGRNRKPGRDWPRLGVGWLFRMPSLPSFWASSGAFGCAADDGWGSPGQDVCCCSGVLGAPEGGGI